MTLTNIFTGHCLNLGLGRSRCVTAFKFIYRSMSSCDKQLACKLKILKIATRNGAFFPFSLLCERCQPRPVVQGRVLTHLMNGMNGVRG